MLHYLLMETHLKIQKDSDLSPIEYLDFEKHYLDQLDSNAETASPLLRFWEAETYFVVLGASNKAAVECNVLQCERDNVDILKRCSGGGTVLQGPGCLNYALLLPMALDKGLETIQDSNCFIMSHMAKAVQPLIQETVNVKGYTDLAIKDVKFSGNAQRRKRKSLLFHGTLLYDFDLKKVSDYLVMPSKQPDYRNNRAHHEFIRNIPVSKADLIDGISLYWQTLFAS